jgi:hypothetical protein
VATAIALAIATAALAALELALAFLMALAPSDILRRAALEYHYYWERRIVQFEPACARYDSILTYSLKPGICTFRNREFSVVHEVDASGFRNRADESPEIVVVGDSHAMGWGVPQDSTFPALLQARTGRPTMNAAVSSYATARELLSLQRIDLTRTRFLIVQYCSNDLTENQEFVRNNGQLIVKTRTDYDSLVAAHLRTIHYYPGKYIRRFLPTARDAWLKSRQPANAPRQLDLAAESAAFLGALRLSPVRLDSLQLIVIELNARRPSNTGFLERLREDAQLPGNPAWMRRIVTVDVSTAITAADFFFSDDHMRSSGHARVAEVLAARIAALDGGATNVSRVSRP